MPQIFPMNWILLSMNLLISIMCLMSLLYFTLFNMDKKINKNSNIKLNNFYYQW
uniref:ATP synthase F0 subunit 8 n=1 Tax=Dermacentor everestianus TaxID=1167514 RepID=A0A4D6QF77_9ACAR|nr:ATP synthase F0 subunit 8 [Dermacentor everestianus]QCF46396.1 ATP synthase F0 subunit 8 [Dermacentor everestianus]